MDGKRPDYDEATYNNVEIKEFDKFMGMYVELPGDKKESKVLGHVKERQLDHNGKLIGMSNDNHILNMEVYNVDTLIPPMIIKLNTQKMS